MPPPTIDDIVRLHAISISNEAGGAGTLAECSVADRRHAAHLKRFHEFHGKHARLFGKILRANPVVGHDGFVSLG